MFKFSKIKQNSECQISLPRMRFWMSLVSSSLLYSSIPRYSLGPEDKCTSLAVGRGKQSVTYIKTPPTGFIMAKFCLLLPHSDWFAHESCGFQINENILDSWRISSGSDSYLWVYHGVELLLKRLSCPWRNPWECLGYIQHSEDVSPDVVPIFKMLMLQIRKQDSGNIWCAKYQTIWS